MQSFPLYILYKSDFYIKQSKEKQRQESEINFFDKINERFNKVYNRITQ